MGYIEDAELVSMQEAAEGALDSSAVIQARTSVSDGGGGETVEWTTGGTVACRLAPFLRGKDEVEGNRITTDTEVVFTFPAGTDIADDGRILMGGKTYSVVDVKARSQEITRRVTAVEIE